MDKQKGERKSSHSQGKASQGAVLQAWELPSRPGYSALFCATADVADTGWGWQVKGKALNLFCPQGMFGPGYGSLKCCTLLGGCQRDPEGFATPKKEPANTTALEAAEQEQRVQSLPLHCALTLSV